VNDDGYVEAMIHDVTQEVTFEQQQRDIARHMAEAQHLDALGTMAGGLAHDFNNILTAIIGNVEVARMKIQYQPEVDGLMEAVLKSSDKASLLCRQMLAYAGKGRYWVSVLNINSMITEQEGLFCRLAGGEMFWRYHLDQPLPCIRGDTAQLKQLLVNVISNARESYGEKAGLVCLRTMRLTALPEQLTHNHFIVGTSSSIVAICIKDYGDGMTPEVLKQVFEPFFSTRFVGRGLGLSAVLGIVRSHHGAIHISSALGKGTEVCVYFPEDHGD
jgi:signal transduction histidine kinase